MGSNRTRGFVLAIAAVVAAAFGQYWLAAGLMMGALAEMSLDVAETDPDIGRKLQFNTRTTQAPIKLVFGEHKVGSNEIFIDSGGNENKWLYVIDSISEGECEGIKQVNGVDQIWLDEKPATDYPSNLYAYTFYGGSSTQLKDPTIFDVFPSHIDTYTYTCYMVWRFKYDEDTFLRQPSRTYLLKGLKVYDFRTASSNWVDVDVSDPDPLNWTVGSYNPVLCLYDYMTNGRYGKGVSASKIDIDSWTEAANYCDAQGWYLNYAVGSNLPAQTIVDTILRSFRGQLVHFNNQIFLRYSDLDLEIPVFNIKDEHVAIEDVTGRAMIEMYEPPRSDIPDGFRVKYIDPDKDWSTDDIPIGDTIGNIMEFSAVGMGSKQQALDIGVYFLERSRLNRGVRGTFKDDLLVLDPHDLVTITHGDHGRGGLGISGEYFRVRNSNIRRDGLVDIDFICRII